MSNLDKDTKELSIEEILESIRNVIKSRNSSDQNFEDSKLCDKNSTTYVTTQSDEETLELTEKEAIEADSFDYTSSYKNSDIAQDEIVDQNILNETGIILETFAKSISKISSTNNSILNKTLEEFLIDILKPELKEWLNMHLPSIVQKIVKSELSKIVALNSKNQKNLR